MEDFDAKLLDADPTCMTELAVLLNDAMARDTAARASYAAIYGVAWTAINEETYLGSVSMDCSYDTGLAVGTDARTMAR